MEVIWDSPCFKVGLTAGTKLRAVNGGPFSTKLVKDALAKGAIKLSVESLGRRRTVAVDCPGGHRYPHLMPVDGPRRLDEILTPLN